MANAKEVKTSGFKKFMIIIILLIVGLIFYSRFVATKGLEVKEYEITSNKIPKSYEGLKIIHFSDLHYGTTVYLKELEKLVKEINTFNPDIIFFTGDLIDKNYKVSNEEIDNITKLLNKIDANIVSYAVKGNHDYTDSYNKIMDNTNFKVLKNEQQLFYYNDITPLLIIGLEDELMGTVDIPKAFENFDENNYTILLTHEPDLYEKTKEYKSDLVLAGHSHNGQVRIPFLGAVIKVAGAKKYYDEKYLINNTTMYISGGIGTSNYPFRLFNPPSFNFYRLYSE